MEMESFNTSTTSSNVTFINAESVQASVWWSVLFGVSAISTLISLYLFICLTLYVVRKNTTQRGTRKNLSEITAFNKSADFNGEQDQEMQSARKTRSQSVTSSKRLQFDYRKSRSTTKRSSRQVLYIVLLVALGLNLIRGNIELLLFCIGGSSDYICDLLTKLMISFTGFVLHGCGLFLWLRQHIFYSNLRMKHLKPNGKKYISLITYLEMLAALVIILSIHLWWRDYTSSDGLCRPMVGSQRVSPVFAFGLLAFSTVTIQVSLMFLFVYPLQAHKKQVEKHKKVSSKSRSTSQFMKCIKRALIGATIGITTDTLGSLTSILLPEDLPIIVLSVICELDIFLNICCIFYTYRSWKDVVFPWRRKQKRLEF